MVVLCSVRLPLALNLLGSSKVGDSELKNLATSLDAPLRVREMSRCAAVEAVPSVMSDVGGL